jgi:hypothetical protein
MPRKDAAHIAHRDAHRTYQQVDYRQNDDSHQQQDDIDRSLQTPKFLHFYIITLLHFYIAKSL